MLMCVCHCYYVHVHVLYVHKFTESLDVHLYCDPTVLDKSKPTCILSVLITSAKCDLKLYFLAL